MDDSVIMAKKTIDFIKVYPEQNKKIYMGTLLILMGPNPRPTS